MIYAKCKNQKTDEIRKIPSSLQIESMLSIYISSSNPGSILQLICGSSTVLAEMPWHKLVARFSATKTSSYIASASLFWCSAAHARESSSTHLVDQSLSSYEQRLVSKDHYAAYSVRSGACFRKFSSKQDTNIKPISVARGKRSRLPALAWWRRRLLQFHGILQPNFLWGRLWHSAYQLLARQNRDTRISARFFSHLPICALFQLHLCSRSRIRC